MYLVDCFEESSTEQNVVASVGRVRSKWFEKRTSEAKHAAEKFGMGQKDEPPGRKSVRETSNPVPEGRLNLAQDASPGLDFEGD
jgi:hypothetical protein